MIISYWNFFTDEGMQVEVCGCPFVDLFDAETFGNLYFGF